MYKSWLIIRIATNIKTKIINRIIEKSLIKNDIHNKPLLVLNSRLCQRWRPWNGLSLEARSQWPLNSALLPPAQWPPMRRMIRNSQTTQSACHNRAGCPPNPPWKSQRMHRVIVIYCPCFEYDLKMRVPWFPCDVMCMFKLHFFCISLIS